MIDIERPSLSPREERGLESAAAEAAHNRADLEFIAAMGGVELESMDPDPTWAGIGGEDFDE